VDKRWSWVAWSMLAVFIVSMVFATILGVADGSLQQDPANFVVYVLGFGAFMVVGALVVAHRPNNAMGWIFSAIALLAFTAGLAAEYATYALVTRPGSLPGATFAAWYASWPWYPTLGLALLFTPLLFPTGHLLSPRWRPLAWLAGAATAVFTMLAALQGDLVLGNDDLAEHHVVANPIGVAGLENPEESAVGVALLGLLVLSSVVAFVSLVLRFRRSQGEERQQLKWFTYAGALVPLSRLGDFLPGPVVGTLVSAAPIVFLPVAAGIAILRYRLYDIDRVINRTLVYGLLTVLLGAVYLAGVFGLGQLLNPVSGESALAVAASTLAVAALFQPARRRIQQAVDRRFNRRKYNTTKTIEAFSARLREQVDLDAISTEVLAVVDQTMEPTRVSLWLRPSPPGSSGPARAQARPITWAY
jgi:hypothetical protein